MFTQSVLRVLALGCVLAVFALACTNNQTPTGVLISPADRAGAPAVKGETIEGDALSLSSLDGVTLVNFWASWCGPCATETPRLVRIADLYRDRGVNVVGVDVLDNRSNAKAFQREFDMNYPSWFDEPGEIASSFGGIGPSALPSTIILDAEHRVAVRLLGEVTQEQVAGFLDGLLAETLEESVAGSVTGGGGG